MVSQQLSKTKTGQTTVFFVQKIIRKKFITYIIITIILYNNNRYQLR